MGKWIKFNIIDGSSLDECQLEITKVHLVFPGKATELSDLFWESGFHQRRVPVTLSWQNWKDFEGKVILLNVRYLQYSWSNLM